MPSVLPDIGTAAQISGFKPAIGAVGMGSLPVPEEPPATDDGRAPVPVFSWGGNHVSHGAPVVGLEYDGRRLAFIAIRKERTRRTISRLWVAESTRALSAAILTDHLRPLFPEGRPVVEIVVGSPRGVVRRFVIPPVPTRQRVAAARWQGGQIIPFPLTEREALYGFQFAAKDARGWQVTLVALPREDAAPILEAVESLGWGIRRVWLAGTQPPPCATAEADQTAVTAVVLCSAQRASFAVFRHGALQFHYDLGSFAGLAAGASGEGLDFLTTAQRVPEVLWAKMNDALNFSLNADRDLMPGQLFLVGIPETLAPLVTEWRDRFPAGVTVVDPVRELAEHLPAEVRAWVHGSPSHLAPAVLAAIGTAAIDLTPASVRTRQRQHRLKQAVRSLCIVSVIAALVWTLLLWQHVRNSELSVGLLRTENAVLQNSPPIAEATHVLTAISERRTVLAMMQRPSAKWMPWVRTVLSTVPVNGSLTSFSVAAKPSGPPGVVDRLSVRLEGTLEPGNVPHALTYRHWISRLETPAGPGRVAVVDERTVEWKGRQRSVFALELSPPKQIVAEQQP